MQSFRNYSLCNPAALNIEIKQNSIPRAPRLESSKPRSPRPETAARNPKPKQLPKSLQNPRLQAGDEEAAAVVVGAGGKPWLRMTSRHLLQSPRKQTKLLPTSLRRRRAPRQATQRKAAPQREPVPRRQPRPTRPSRTVLLRKESASPMTTPARSLPQLRKEPGIPMRTKPLPAGQNPSVPVLHWTSGGPSGMHS